MIQNIMRMNVLNRLSCQRLGLAVALLYSREFDMGNCSYPEDIKIRNVMLHMEQEEDIRLYN